MSIKTSKTKIRTYIKNLLNDPDLTPDELDELMDTLDDFYLNVQIARDEIHEQEKNAEYDEEYDESEDSEDGNPFDEPYDEVE